jgi:hypothetical protein
MNHLESPTERELARRLRDLAETTTMSDDAWDRLAARTVAESPASSRASLRSRSVDFTRRTRGRCWPLQPPSPC